LVVGLLDGVLLRNVPTIGLPDVALNAADVSDGKPFDFDKEDAVSTEDDEDISFMAPKSRGVKNGIAIIRNSLLAAKGCSDGFPHEALRFALIEGLVWVEVHVCLGKGADNLAAVRTTY